MSSHSNSMSVSDLDSYSNSKLDSYFKTIKMLGIHLLDFTGHSPDRRLTWPLCDLHLTWLDLQPTQPSPDLGSTHSSPFTWPSPDLIFTKSHLTYNLHLTWPSPDLYPTWPSYDPTFIELNLHQTFTWPDLHPNFTWPGRHWTFTRPIHYQAFTSPALHANLTWWGRTFQDQDCKPHKLSLGARAFGYFIGTLGSVLFRIRFIKPRLHTVGISLCFKQTVELWRIWSKSYFCVGVDDGRNGGCHSVEIVVTDHVTVVVVVVVNGEWWLWWWWLGRLMDARWCRQWQRWGCCPDSTATSGAILLISATSSQRLYHYYDIASTS